MAAPNSVPLHVLFVRERKKELFPISFLRRNKDSLFVDVVVVSVVRERKSGNNKKRGEVERESMEQEGKHLNEQ